MRTFRFIPIHVLYQRYFFSLSFFFFLTFWVFGSDKEMLGRCFRKHAAHARTLFKYNTMALGQLSGLSEEACSVSRRWLAKTHLSVKGRRDVQSLSPCAWWELTAATVRFSLPLYTGADRLKLICRWEARPSIAKPFWWKPTLAKVRLF